MVQKQSLQKKLLTSLWILKRVALKETLILLMFSI